MKRSLSLLVRFGLAGGCLVYALWGVDITRLRESLLSFRPWYLFAYAAAVLLSMVPCAWRLRFLTGHRIDTLLGLRATFICQAVNNLLPAKLGEMTKALYLRREVGMSLGQSLETVFWERFFDLNALLVLGAAVAVMLGKGLVLYPLLGVVGAIWCFLVLLRLKPELAHALIRLVPGQRLRLFASEMLLLLEANLRPGFLFRLSLWTGLIWLGYLAGCALGLCLMADIPVDPALILTVFTVSSLGFAVPSAPGAMGVYEASIVLALGWFGVDKDRAFAAGLTMHALQFLPVTLIGLLSLASGGMSLRDLRRQVPQDAETT